MSENTKLPTTITVPGIVAVAEEHEHELSLPVSCDRGRGYYEVVIASTESYVYKDKVWHMFVAYRKPDEHVCSVQYRDCTILYIAHDEYLAEAQVSEQTMDLEDGNGNQTFLILSLKIANLDPDVEPHSQNLFLDQHIVH